MPKKEKPRGKDKALVDLAFVEHDSVTYVILQSLCASDAEKRRMVGRIKGGKSRWRSSAGHSLLKDIVDCIESHAPLHSERAINGIVRERFSGEGKPAFRIYSPARLRLIVKAVLAFISDGNKKREIAQKA